MAPTPQQTMVSGKTEPLKRLPPGEEVVISGISGIFPSSDSVSEFMDNLYNKVDMVTSEDPRWINSHPEAPKNIGIVNGVGKFDAQFFRVHYKQACTMEPMSRKLLEHAYGAIYDSGTNPCELRGKKVGVFIGSTYSESEKLVIYENVQRNGFGITGCNRAMYANRISYWLDGKGPSYSVDVACASSTACLEHAYRSIRTGQCEAAIVGGCNLCMHPNVSLQYRRAGFVCFDGKTKCFDKNGDGFARADAISVIFLQKAKYAKRIYSELYYAKQEYSPTSEPVLPLREPKELTQFFEAFYSEAGVSPDDVEYIEANGAAFPEADIVELKVIGEVFGKNKPIKIGCVKSNMGSSQAASGICGITRICLAYHKGELSGNLHYNEPLLQDMPETQNKVQVLTGNEHFGRGFAALNSFSYSGANIHVLLKGYCKQKDSLRYKSGIPYLILISGRQDDLVKNILQKIQTKPIESEEIALLYNIHQYDIPGHMSRGYSILDTDANNETITLSESVEYYPGISRPVWFVYSGMGSQWPTMGAELMKIPIFAAAIHKCQKVLEPKGVDIIKILTDPDKTIYDNILHSFVGIAAVQIGLTDILKELGVVPDHIIGHSVGELGCAYADGCFTAEEMILAAYSRGLVSVQTPFIQGSMAAVGLGYKTVLPICPPEIEVACHNSSESSTISGPADIMKQFVSRLTSQGIFAKEVPCSNIAYHSRYIADAGPNLLKYLSEVIKNPKERSEKWYSTSVPIDNWDTPISKYSSAEYHTNNLLNPVLFEETSKLIPPNALVVEIAPHGLLQAILKRSLVECVHVSLTKRRHSNPIKYLLEALGKLYQAGLNLKMDVLYPKVEFPVSVGTPFLSRYVEWEHGEDWPQAKYNMKDKVEATIRDFVMSIYDDDYAYFKGHVRDGNYVFPESALLVLVWETLAMYKGVANYRDLSVIFKKVHFHGEIIIRPEIPVKFQIMIFKGNYGFEITYEDYIIVSGFVSTFELKNNMNRNLKESQRENALDKVTLHCNDIYTLMRLKGYEYKEEFQSIYSSIGSRNKASVKWTDNWITYIDSLIQLNAFTRNFNGVSVPQHIEQLLINTEGHKTAKFVSFDNMTCLNADVYSIYDYTISGGVEIDGLVFKDIPIVEQKPDVMLTQQFIPHFLSGDISITTVFQINLQIITENVSKNVVNIKIVSSNINEMAKVITEVTNDMTSHEFNIKTINNAESATYSDVVVIDSLLTDEKKMNEIYNNIPPNSFILALEQDTTGIHPSHKMFNVITAMSVEKQLILLLRKTVHSSDEIITYMPIVHDETFSWVPRLQMELKRSNKVMLISERQHCCGLLGLVKQLKKEHGNKIGLTVIDDFHAPNFNAEKDIFKDQLEKKLSYNVLKKGKWGGYYNISNISSKPNEHLENIYLTSTMPGDIDALAWIEKPLMPESKNLIQVCYAGISIEDAKVASGKSVLTEQAFGMDFSGINKNGEKIMGVVSGGALGSNVVADPDLLWQVPGHWSLEDAASVPLAYTHAYYCLTIRSRLLPGSVVLINGGAGALCQAIISICLSMECSVYVAGCNAKQKKCLLIMYPELQEDHITRDPLDVFQNIVDDVKNKKKVRFTLRQRRADFVINCLSGSMRKAAIQCIGDLGSFIDTCDYDMTGNEDFGMQYLFQATHYLAAHLNTIFSSKCAKERKFIQLKIAEGIANGVVRPLVRLVYTPDNVSKAFRMLSADNHIGKILIKMKNLESVNKLLDVTTRMLYCPRGSYIVVGDESALSIELVDRLVKNGARKLVVHMKPNLIAGYTYTKLLSWNKFDVSIKNSSENLQTEKGCENLIKRAVKLGPIKGIFIVHNFNCFKSSGLEVVGAKFQKTVGVVANLDMASRNVCNEMEHFVVLNYSSRGVCDEYISSVTDKICWSRNEVGLPGLVFRARLVKELEDSALTHPKFQLQPISAMFNALEASLNQKLTNVITYNVKKHLASVFIEKVSRIIGTNNIDEFDDKLTLNDLHLNEVSMEEINTAIKKAHCISYPFEKLKRMTIANLKNLGSNSLQSSDSDVGLGAFFTYIDKDECLAAEPIVTMATSYGYIMEEENLDPKATYLMLVPGFEGHHQIFTTLSERLKVQALTCQLVPDMSNDSIPQIAANIAKFIKKRLEIKTKFYLLGYSFGINIAFELARIFEEEGHVGVVYCLDSSPDALRAQLDAYIGNLTDSQLQNAIVQHMYQLMSGRRSTELKQELERKDNWNDKVELCVNKLRGLVNYSHQYKRGLLNSAYRRIILAREYEPDFKLESELVLIKGIPHPNMNKLADDFSLSNYSRQPVKIFDIDSDHASAHQDCRVSNIVNRYLESKLLEEFSNKNLCWSYFADPMKTF